MVPVPHNTIGAMTQPAPPATSSGNAPDRPDLQSAFKRVLWEILLVLGERARPVGESPMIPHALLALISARLRGLQWRFLRLVERAQAGTLTPVRPRARRSRPADAPKVPRAPDPLPRRAGWLAKLCPNVWYGQRPISWAAAGFSTLLEDERLRGLLASDPRFGRTLRPLWRMLRAEPPPECLRLPPRPRRPRVPRAKPDIGLPIPKGVTRRDIARSRAMAQPPPQPPPSPPPVPPTQQGTATDWTPTHLTRDGRNSVFDPIPDRGRRREDIDWGRRWGPASSR
jgi:hypothetical protein